MDKSTSDMDKSTPNMDKSTPTDKSTPDMDKSTQDLIDKMKADLLIAEGENRRLQASLSAALEENAGLHKYIQVCERTLSPDNPPFRMPFAGESEIPSPDSVLSHCYGALLPMFTTAEATVLRLLCKEFKTTVAEFPWYDSETIIRGSVASWRACFPRSKFANVTENSHEEGHRRPPW